MAIRIAQAYSYRHAEAILDAEFAMEKREIVESITASRWIAMTEPRERKRKGKVVAVLTIDQDETNKAIEGEFHARGWDIRPKIISKAGSDLRSDFRKGKIQVEVQLGNMARWYTMCSSFCCPIRRTISKSACWWCPCKTSPSRSTRTWRITSA
jgi:hypothetical protein